MTRAHSFREVVITPLLALGLSLSVGGCGKKETAGGPGGPPGAGGPPPAVTVSKPVEKEIVEWNEYIGRTGAVESVEIRARVSGYLTEVCFKAGDIVKKGAPLFVIDPRPYQADFDRAQGQLEQAEANLRLAQNDLDRAKDLRTKNVIAANEFDSKVAGYKQNEANTSAAKAAVQTAQLNLDFCRINSPIEGRVSRERVTVGNLIQPSGAADGILTTVVSIDPIYAYLDVDENTILNYIKLNSEGKLKTARESIVPLYLGLQNEEGFPHEGTVDFVDNRIDPSTGTMQVRGIFKTWDSLLTPGFFVRVRAAASPKYKALLLPDKAIGVDQGQRFVIVVGADKKAEYRTVQLGPLAEGLRVIRDGLKPGDLVVVNGVQRVRPGAVVDPKEEQVATPPEGPNSAPRTDKTTVAPETKPAS